MRSRFFLAILLAWIAFQPVLSFSDPVLPVLPDHLQCLDNNHQVMGFNNAQVESWETTTANQFLARGMVEGKITNIYPNETGHNHFAIALGNGQGIEVIYQYAFGPLPTLQIGMDVIACGDYITVGPHAQEPSPMPAILHWVHWNPGNRDGGRHPGGFIVINNVAYGITGGN